MLLARAVRRGWRRGWLRWKRSAIILKMFNASAEAIYAGGGSGGSRVAAGDGGSAAAGADAGGVAGSWAERALAASR